MKRKWTNTNERYEQQSQSPKLKSSKRPKGNDDVNVIEEQIKVVKCGINKVVRDDEILKKINEDVLEISQLVYEVSLYIMYDIHAQLEDGRFNGEKINFLSYFYSLLDTKKNSKSVLYENLRASFGLGKYSKSYRSNLFIQQAQLYETVFENNIWMHAWNRVRKFLHKIYAKDDKYSKKTTINTLLYLFYENKPIDGDIYKIPWTKGHFCNLKKDVYSKLADFYYIWKINNINGYKNFSLFPKFSLRRHHINYDKYAFYQLLCSVKQCPTKLNKNQTKLINQTFKDVSPSFKFSQYLNVPDKTKSFTTDGVVCCIRMLKPLNKDPISKSSENRELNRDPTHIETAVNIGIDPGSKLFVGGIRTINFNPRDDIHNEKIKYSSRRFYTECGHYSRKYKLEKWTKQSRQIEKQRPAKQSIEEYIRFELQHFSNKRKEFLKSKVARLKFDAYIQRRKTLKKLIDTLFVKEEKRVTVFWGSAKQASDSPIKGYIKSPHSEIVKQLKLHPKVQYVEVDEYKSTKTCSHCLTDTHHTVSKSPHRFSCCTQCKIVWNRDVNAGINILLMGFYNYSLRS